MQILENEPPEAVHRDRTQRLNKVQLLENEPLEVACRDEAQCLKKVNLYTGMNFRTRQRLAEQDKAKIS